MLKTIFAATMAVILISGTGFAQSSTYSRTTTETASPSLAPDVDVTKTTKRTTERDGVTVEKDKKVTRDVDGDVTSKTKTETSTVR